MMCTSINHACFAGGSFATLVTGFTNGVLLSSSALAQSAALLPPMMAGSRVNASGGDRALLPPLHGDTASAAPGLDIDDPSEAARGSDMPNMRAPTDAPALVVPPSLPTSAVTDAPAFDIGGASAAQTQTDGQLLPDLSAETVDTGGKAAAEGGQPVLEDLKAPGNTASDAPVLDIDNGLGGQGPVIGQPVASEPTGRTEGGPSNCDFSFKATAYHEKVGFDDNAGNNPGNAIFAFADSRDVIEARPEIACNYGAFLLEASPRVGWEGIKTSRADYDDTQTDTEAEIRYGKLSFTNGPVQLQVGRYVNMWGPSVFTSPTNPFHDRSSQISPYTELPARDYLQGSYAMRDTNVTIGAIYNFGRGDQIGPDKRIIVLTGDWYGESTAATAIVEGTEDWYGVGGYGQWTLNDAAVLYADGLVRYGKRRLPEVDPYGLRPADHNSLSAKVLVGGSYSFTDGTTVALEYLHNSEGYDANETETVFDLFRKGLLPDATPDVRRTIGEVSDISFFDLRQNYLMGRINKDDVIEGVNASVLYAYNVDDQSGRLIGNIDWLLSDDVTVFFNAVAFHGGKDSEFGRFTDNQIAVGLTWQPTHPFF